MESTGGWITSRAARGVEGTRWLDYQQGGTRAVRREALRGNQGVQHVNRTRFNASGPASVAVCDAGQRPAARLAHGRHARVGG